MIRKRLVSIIFLLADILCIALSWFFALYVRFEMNLYAIPPNYLISLSELIIPITLFNIVILALFHQYRRIWAFFSVEEFLSIVEAFAVIGIFYVIIFSTIQIHLPRSVALIAYIFSFVSVTAIRVSSRLLRRYDVHHRKDQKEEHRILVIGAGQAGQMIVKDLKDSRTAHNTICCFVDDDPNKIGKYLNDIPVKGNRKDIPDLVDEYNVDQIVFAIPTASGEDKKSILTICQEQTDCNIQVIPSIRELVNGTVRIEHMRPVEIEDLLGRDRIEVNNEEIFDFLEDKVVLVTGGGGSIGSELCRQIAQCSPRKLIVFDIYENNVYALQQELKMQGYTENIEYLIGSVRNKTRIDDIIEVYHPEVIYHAAAHKHVPLMEDSPHEAVKNNVFGTYNVAKSAGEHKVPRFVLISTDKAVNPTNVMGTTKRLCEEVIQDLDKRYLDTNFAAVRFGNVLGSNGSVIPLFKSQIANGGPVTITHKDITRYFMTIPEAVSLVLQASYYAKHGEIFVLDMGSPIKIDDMARKLIRLSGFEPERDIEIVYTGLRPGEKLYEELLMDEEGLQKTENKLIYIGKPIVLDPAEFEETLTRLYASAYDESSDIVALLHEVVPTFVRQKA